MKDVLSQLATVTPALIVTLVLIVGDIVVGSVAAAITKTFSFPTMITKKLPKLFFYTFAVAISKLVEVYLFANAIPITQLVEAAIGVFEITSILRNIKLATGLKVDGIISQIDKNDPPDSNPT